MYQLSTKADTSVVAAWRTAVLVGAGRMGQAHGQALAAMGVPLVAVCDRRPEARESTGISLGIPAERRFADADSLYRQVERPDLVVVATTADSHCAQVERAAAAGARAILCEKPLATSVADCDTMIARCRDSGSLLAVNHQMRFMDQYLAVKAVLESGALGRLASMTAIGGCYGLAMNGSHYVEALMVLTGSTPASASAWFSGDPVPNPRGPQFFDQAGEMRIVTADGRRLNLVIGADQGHGMTVTYAGAYGHIFVDELAGEMIVTERLAEHRGQPATRYGMPSQRRCLQFPVADNVGPTRAVLEALRAEAGYPDGETGRTVVATLAACWASAGSDGRAIDLATLGDNRALRFPWA